MSRHADNIGRNIIALQHPKETLHEFVARCDHLRTFHEAPPPEPVRVQEPSDFQCDECQDTGKVAVLEGTRWAIFDCENCIQRPA